MKNIRIAELFAGVGGFRLGLEGASSPTVKYEVVWSSQWEPGASTQHASEIYEELFGSDGHSNEDIQKVIDEDFGQIRDHDLLVGGFPCQDYSVARTANQAAGLIGKKGVLWWSIFNILKNMGEKAPRYLMLENVDRLLKSPTAQRGRDFAVMLASLSDLGYVVEWRVVNAADYGMPQRRRRIFILGYRKNTDVYKRLYKSKDIAGWIRRDGVLADAFPVEKSDSKLEEFNIEGDLPKVSDEFSKHRPTRSLFDIAGVMIGRKVYTTKTTPSYKGKRTVLGDVIIKDEKKIPEEYFIKDKDLEKWKKLKDAKKERRESKSGHVYFYSEGPMVFPDSLDKPSRTIVTGEGGSSPSRFKHVIRTESGRLRRLMPEELERLNMFPAGHTRLMHEKRVTPDTKRAFIMGNALVVGVIQRLGKSLAKFV